MSLPLSILDLAPVVSGTPAEVSVRRTVDLARHAEALGYLRVWYAEHHALPSVASSAPEILIASSAAATRTIRLGAGGIMLPNHAPLKVAENFHTLQALYPGRVDLGIGRAPGGSPAIGTALRAQRGDLLPQQLQELFRCSRAGASALDGEEPDTVHAEPREVSLPPVWLLGSSGASARYAGSNGLGYSFAAHFSPSPPGPPMRAYRESFQPSAMFARPQAILGVAAVCADTHEEAQRLASTMELAWLRIQRGRFLPLPSPEEALAHVYSPWEQEALAEIRGRTIVGTPAEVRARLEALAAETQADEVMIVANIHDHAARLRSYELIQRAFAR